MRLPLLPRTFFVALTSTALFHYHKGMGVHISLHGVTEYQANKGQAHDKTDSDIRS